MPTPPADDLRDAIALARGLSDGPAPIDALRAMTHDELGRLTIAALDLIRRALDPELDFPEFARWLLSEEGRR